MNAIAALTLCSLLAAPSLFAACDVELLPMSKQNEVRDAWLAKRHGMLLDMMRRHEADWWIVVNEEFHDDPLMQYVAPARPYAGNRDYLIFIDAGEAGLRKVAVAGYAEEVLLRTFEMPEDPKPAKETLPRLYRETKPKRIALGIGGSRGMTRSLGWDARNTLASILGPEATKKFVSASGLIEEYLDTRIEEERPHYRTLVALTDSMIRRALSNEAIEPGVTTAGDLRNFLYDRLWECGVGTWFQPDIRIQRKGETGSVSRGFLSVAREADVIQRGDVLHVDFGINYMGLASDWQKMAYVLREGETEAPSGLRAALANTNLLQDAVMSAARPGKAAGEVYREAMAAMEARGIEAQIYSHPLGNHGHAMGPSIDFRSAKRGENESRPLRPGSYISIELNTRTAVPEWDGQKVFMMEEDPAHLTDEGYRFFVPRQESLYLIR